MSPNAFHAALRIDLAKRLLLTTEPPVTEVCLESGYEGLGTFTSRFGRLIGVSPSRLRRLPELAAPVVEGLAGRFEPQPRWDLPVGMTGVWGRVVGPAPSGSLVFVGLFPAGIAQGPPVAGATIPGPGAFDLAAPPDDRYRLLAVALPMVGDPTYGLLPARPLLVDAGQAPVVVRR